MKNNKTRFRRKLYVLIMVLMIGYVNTTLGQFIPYIPMQTDADLDNMTIAANSEPGSVVAQSTVLNGTASYTVPFAMPTGTGNVVPQIALNYTSMGRSSTFGYGWGLSGLSVISRTGQNIYFDNQTTGVNYNSTDRLVMDGNRLVGTNGTYLSPGSTYAFEAENFSTITAYGGTPGNPSYFIMETKDGIKYEYGNGFESKNYHDGTLIKEWYISKMIYPDGNYITYKYKANRMIGFLNVAQHLIDEIAFTANDIAGISNFATVNFIYKVRNDNNSWYQNGFETKQSLLTEEIQVKIQNQNFRTYTFKYSNRNGNSFLSEIEEKNSTLVLNKTKLKYGDEPNILKVNNTARPVNLNDNYFPSNLNGDGITDLLLARKNATNPIYHQYFHGTSDAAFSINLPAKTTVKGVSDNNGDQIDDVAVMQLIDRQEVVIDPNGNPQIQYFKVHRFKVYHNGNLSGGLNYGQIYELPIMVDSIYRENDEIGDIVGGDYNGDGLGDYLFINYNAVYVTYGQRSITQPLSAWVPVSVTSPNFTQVANWGADVEKLIPMEYDGDGKTDILLINGAWSGIFSFTTNTQMTQKFFNNASVFDQAHLIYPGDFNGDGRTDFLRREGGQSSTDWKILYNLGGASFIYSNFFFPRTPSITQPSFGVYHGDVVSTGDYNGDGKSDVLLIGNEGWSSHYTDLILSKGISFNAPIYEIHANVPFANSITGSDYIGIDGKARNLFRLNSIYDPLEISMSPKYKDNLLVKIKNGELHTTFFDYKLMTEKIDVSDDFYERGPISNATALISNAQVPVWLVKDYKVQNGNGTSTDYGDGVMKVQSMKYAGAKVQRTGKGMIGFAKTCQEDKWSYLRTLTYHSANDVYGIMLPDSVVTEFVTGADFTKSHTQHQLTGLGGNRYLMKAQSMTNYNYHESRISTQVFNQYDAYANPTLVTSTVQTGLSGTVTESSTTTSVYGAFGSSIPNKPTQMTTAMTRGGSTYTSTADIEYYSTGQVYRKKEFAGQAKEVTTEYEYWPYGGIKRTTKTATGLPVQTLHTTYDPLGRYITLKKNTDNETIYYAEYQDNLSNSPTLVTDEKGITNQYFYDAMGRLVGHDEPTGISNSVQYDWDGTNGGKMVTETGDGKPTRTTYYDALGKKRKTEVTGFNGDIITQTMTYDLLGNLYQSTAPYKAGESILTTTNTYGASYTAQRLQGITTNVPVFGSTQYAYVYDQGHETVVTTAPDGKVTSTKMDAAGKTLQTSDSKGNVLDFTYYSHGGLKDVKQGNTTLVEIEYDAFNRKSKLTDVSAGIIHYDHDAYGRLISETNAKGQTTTYTYDKYDRPETITRPEGVTMYEYWPGGTAGKAYLLKKVTGHAGDMHEMDYDIYGRTISEKVTIDGVSHTSTLQYDIYNRVVSRTLPSGLNQQYEYDDYGYLKRIYSGGTTYLTVNEINGRGQVTKYTLGNGKQSIHTYFHGVPTKYATTDGYFEYNMQWDYKNGNLMKRWDHYGNKDTMEYDILDRLARWTTYGSDMSISRDTMTYADNGNILSKTGVGAYTYDPVKIYATTEITNPKGLIKDAEQHITYNSFLQPDTITEGPYRLVYTYGYHGNRIKSVLYKNNVIQETKYYIGDYEKVVTSQGTAQVQYISMEGHLKVIISSQGSTHTPYYVYTDHLGSILDVTDGSGNSQGSQTYDPWGRRRSMGVWSSYLDENLPNTRPVWYYRGYTGHEHLREFRLINMNGRMYDPELARMLSPDNLIQDGGYSQNYNRYSYAYNNPLKYTDPDGNEITLASAMIISAMVSVITNGVSNHFQGKPFYQGAVQSALWGAATGGFSFGIGEVAQTIGNAYLRFGFQTVAHGLYNGIASEIQGGKFVHGFSAGAISSFGAGLAKDVLKLGTVSQIFVGGILGGTSASIAGGDFFRGFAQGLILSAFNHALHNTSENGGSTILNNANELSENEYNKLSDENKKQYVKKPKEALVMERETILQNTQTPTGQKIYVSTISRDEIWGKYVYVKSKNLVQRLESFKSLFVDFMENISISFQTYSYSHNWLQHHGPNILNLITTNKTTTNINIYYNKYDYSNGMLCNYINILK